jgi:hypothetical protein
MDKNSWKTLVYSTPIVLEWWFIAKHSYLDISFSTDQHSTYILTCTVVHWIYKIWTDDNHAVDLTDTDIMEKIDYVHNNPIRAGLVDSPLHYIYSIAN